MEIDVTTEDEEDGSEGPTLQPTTCITPVVSGTAVRVAAVNSEYPNQEPKEVIRDEVHHSGQTPSQRNASVVRTVLVSILSCQANRWLQYDMRYERRSEAWNHELSEHRPR